MSLVKTATVLCALLASAFVLVATAPAAPRLLAGNGLIVGVDYPGMICGGTVSCNSCETDTSNCKRCSGATQVRFCQLASPSDVCHSINSPCGNVEQCPHRGHHVEPCAWVQDPECNWTGTCSVGTTPCPCLACQ